MSLIATDPVPEAQTIDHDGFWSAVDTAHARAAMRVDDGTVVPARLTHALITAMIEVGRDLDAWRARQIAQGYPRLADVPTTETIAGEPVALHCYRRAVYCYAKANLIERMTDYDLTASGQRKTEQLDEAPDALRRDALWAIARIQGRSRATVELI